MTSNPNLKKNAGKRIAVIGYGAMGQRLVQGLRDSGGVDVDIAVLERCSTQARHSGSEDVEVFSSMSDLLAWGPQAVVECAGHAAVKEVVIPLLAAGVDAIVASVGAFSDEAVHASALEACASSGARMTLVSGAMGGLDALRAAAAVGFDRVEYVGRKPPGAWRGTPAEAVVDLASVTEPVVIFKGSAGESARQFPKNANVTAAIALAGVGFQDTHVILIADPNQDRNIHELNAHGAFGRISIRLENTQLPANPKTSWLAALSIESAVHDWLGR